MPILDLAALFSSPEQEADFNSNNHFLYLIMGFPGGSVVKNPLANAGVEGSIPGSGRSPTAGNGNPLSILAWKILWTEEPGGLQSTGSQKNWT